MQHARPLQDHPEFSVIEHGIYREYRVENWRLARDGSRKKLRFYGWTWLDAIAPLLVAYLWPKLYSRIHFAVLSLALVLYLYSRCTQVLWESVVAIPHLGIQLETHRGLPNRPLTVSRRFIPLAYLRDFVINEALRRWDARYYLVAIQDIEDEEVKLEVAYENILPYFPILLHVYRDIHELMEDQDGVDSDQDGDTK